ncbi:HMO1 [Candida margitis]|uniref:HMO1 n=1 Tax=Candida margitis TaxID=1775924 RepID=UPI0022271FE1|nr:HMO1 [Candida margitis]KAI5968223.1 HMO1 [Candida margitis]
MSELKASKDALIASLFELSKAAQEAAKNAVDFYKIATGGNEDVTAEQLQGIQEAMKAAADSASGVKHGLEGASNGDKKKRKVEKDPNAPKKPLTMFFAFSFHLRKLIAEERKKKGLPNLGAIDLNQRVKERWDNISEEEKSKWKHKYEEEMKLYNAEKAKYEQSLKDGSDYKRPEHPYSSGYEETNTPLAEEVVEEEEADIPAPSLSQEELKKKKKKQEKKEKKKKLAAGSP